MSLRPLLLSIASVALLLSAGCRTLTGGSCHKQQPYESAESLPSLRIPAGLDGPDTGGALAIPDINEPQMPLDPDGPCLDAPPAITAPPPPPSEIVVPDRPSRNGRAPAGEAQDGSAAEQPESQRRRRGPR